MTINAGARARHRDGSVPTHPHSFPEGPGALARIAELTAEIDALMARRRHLVYERMRLRRALALTGRPHSDERKAKIGAAHKGKVLTKAHIKAVSAAQRLRFQDPEAREHMRQLALAREHRKRGMRVQDKFEAAIFGSRL